MKNKLITIVATCFCFSACASKLPAEVALAPATEIIAKALACGTENGWKLSVAVVNAEGNLIAFQRADDAFLGSIDLSIAKAKSSNAFRRPTKAFVEGVNSGNMGLVSVNGVIAIAGGVPINISGAHLGAIGVSGATAAQDEQCALAALK